MPCSDSRDSSENQAALARDRHLVAALRYLIDKGGYVIAVDSTPHDHGVAYATKTRDHYTGILCSLVRKLTPEQVECWVYNGRDPRARQLANWVDEHMGQDAARLKLAEERMSMRWPGNTVNVPSALLRTMLSADANQEQANNARMELITLLEVTQ